MPYRVMAATESLIEFLFRMKIVRMIATIRINGIKFIHLDPVPYGNHNTYYKKIVGNSNPSFVPTQTRSNSIQITPM